MISLVADTVTEVVDEGLDMAVNASPTLFDKVLSLFGAIPESYHFIVYFAVLFIVCVSFKFLIDFLKIIFSMIFSKGGF